MVDCLERFGSVSTPGGGRGLQTRCGICQTDSGWVRFPSIPAFFDVVNSVGRTLYRGVSRHSAFVCTRTHQTSAQQRVRTFWENACENSAISVEIIHSRMAYQVDVNWIRLIDRVWQPVVGNATRFGHYGGKSSSLYVGRVIHRFCCLLDWLVDSHVPNISFV